MTESCENWAELGTAWSTIDPNGRVLAARLFARLRRQSGWMSAVVAVGLPLCGVGTLLGMGTIAAGLRFGIWNFVTRGIAIVAMSVVIGLAVWSLLPIRSPHAARAVQEMIGLAIERVQRTLSLLHAALHACVIVAVFGLVGTAIRTHFGRPPKQSPTLGLAIVALITVIIALCAWRIRFDLMKYRTLKRALITAA